jgi:diaminohydroxyphosphoribosylaminopyrimidine deaminase/5-amino-6-(5-phosphoribosylamino)uracil reductase
MFTAADHAFMTQALRLAEQGLYTTTPNPRVGCVIVHDGKVVGEGWHEKAGAPHAEVNALRAAGEMARGATAYVTLEPCSHYGRTPPCAEALASAGVAKVIAAMRDPNPQVAGNGFALLQFAGISALIGLMETEARELNIGFVSRMTRGRPWVRIKTASSLDGKTALANGTSFWITGEAARRDVHRLRARSCAILTGIGTVLADDPQMNVRDVETMRQPLRVVVDSSLRISPSAKILAGGNVLVATASEDEQRIAKLIDAGAEVLVMPSDAGRVDLEKLMFTLGKRDINELMVEAGCTLNGALLAAGLVDELVMYIAPVLLGDKARGLFGLLELSDMSQRQELNMIETVSIGQDMRIRARVKTKA